MRIAAVFIIGSAALLGIGLWRRAQRAQVLDLGNAPQAMASEPQAEDPPAYETALDYVNVWGAIEQQMDQHNTEQDMSDSNLRAFLRMIQVSEGTAGHGDPYAVCYGYSHTITDFSDHPANTGEWKGARLPDAMCQAAGFGPGCVSTAAGAYQIIRPTWNAVQKALGLADFGPESQDAAAAYLIRQRGAMEAVQAGRFSEAVNLCRREWASLPGAGYGQPESRLSDLRSVYLDAGGTVA